MMIIIKSSFCIFRNSRTQSSTFVNHLSKCLSSNNLPEPKQEPHIPQIAYRFPIHHRDPVPQKLLKKIRVEYHAVEASNFNDDTTLWFPIYRFPYVEGTRRLVRAKVYMTTITALVGLNQFIKFALDPASRPLLYGTLLSTVGVATISIIGNFTRKLVCQIYVSENCEFIRFCRFTFFAKRLDMILPASKVIPLAENNVSLRDSFLKIEIRKPEDGEKLLEGDSIEYYDESYRICLIFGGVSDFERFEAIFGKFLSRKRS